MRPLGKQLIRFLRANLLRRPIILIYQMGKVGSRSVYCSLKDQQHDQVFHSHRLNPNNIEAVRQEHVSRGMSPPQEPGLRIFPRIKKHRGAVFVISPVRDPISRNMSAFFQNFKRFTGEEYSRSTFDVSVLREKFLEGYNHKVPLEWFDVEMKPSFGIDVFAYSFPKEQGYTIIQQGKYRLLIYKTELDIDQQQSLVRDFLGLSSFRLQRFNVGKDKNYKSTYEAFLAGFTLPEDYVESMYNSKYVKQFYTDDEIEEFRVKWTGRSTKV